MGEGKPDWDDPDTLVVLLVCAEYRVRPFSAPRPTSSAEGLVVEVKADGATSPANLVRQSLLPCSEGW